MEMMSRELPIKSQSYTRLVRTGCSPCAIRVDGFITVIGCSSFFFSSLLLKRNPNKADLHFFSRQTTCSAALCRITGIQHK